MKLQHLSVIFILIILPIIIVLSLYVNTQITLIKTEEAYDSKLLNSTYDAIKAFQLNGINNERYSPETRVKNVEASVNTFFNSLVTALGYDGSKKEVMKEYVPAVVFTTYDGYYIYSPFKNTLTGVTEEVDDNYRNNETLDGLKPHVYYCCRYKKTNKYDVIINYTLDNYISIEGIVEGKYWSAKDHCGYLIDGDEGLNATDEVLERLNETLLEFDNTKNPPYYLKKYYYTLRDGTKYYYKSSNSDGNLDGIAEHCDNKDSIFYIDEEGARHTQVIKNNNEEEFKDYYEEIFNNTTAHKYYEESKAFTAEVRRTFGNDLLNYIDKDSPNYKGYEFDNVVDIFATDPNKYIQDEDSNFNRHRRDVIRAVITTNLGPAISGFSNYSSSGEDFMMPKISEVDWELLENNICIATFLQGFRIGGKIYNSYSVVPNNFNKEYVDENDIYILREDHTYTRVNDSTLISDTNLEKGLEYQPGVLKLNLERRKVGEDSYFNLINYKDENDKSHPYLASYTIATRLNSIETADMYRYMRGKTGVIVPPELRRAYYTALGRERYGSYKFTK